MWQKKRFIIPAVSLVLLVLASGLSDNRNEAAQSTQPTALARTAEPTISTTSAGLQDFGGGSWSAEVARIAGSSLSRTEKQDEVYRLGKTYSMDAKTSRETLTYLIGEYRSGRYLSGLADEQYALENILAATVLERHNLDTPTGDFAFDFFQNTKYVYRGVDDPTSAAVDSNERQMERSIREGQLD